MMMTDNRPPVADKPLLVEDGAVGTEEGGPAGIQC